jgi:hypothetical protein
MSVESTGEFVIDNEWGTQIAPDLRFVAPSTKRVPGAPDNLTVNPLPDQAAPGKN